MDRVLPDELSGRTSSTDAVCGAPLDLREAVATVVFSGKRFYFCSRSCHAAFLDTPHRYVGWEYPSAHARDALSVWSWARHHRGAERAGQGPLSFVR